MSDRDDDKGGSPAVVHAGTHQTKPAYEGSLTLRCADPAAFASAVGSLGTPVERTSMNQTPPPPAVPGTVFDATEDARAHERERCRSALKATGWLSPWHVTRALDAIDAVLPGGRAWPTRPEIIADPAVPETDKLRALVEMMAETVTELEDWLGHASTRQAAGDALHRMGRALSAYYGPNGIYMSAHPLEWRGLTWKAMDRAGIGWGEDDELRVRLPTDKPHQHASGPLVSEVLREAPPLLREGAIGIEMNHDERCIRSDECDCEDNASKARELAARITRDLAADASEGERAPHDGRVVVEPPPPHPRCRCLVSPIRLESDAADADALPLPYALGERADGYRVALATITVGSPSPSRKGALIRMRDRLSATVERLADEIAKADAEASR